MRVSSIGSYGYSSPKFAPQKHQSHPNAPAFKADVRVTQFSFSEEEMPENQAKSLLSTLVYAKKAYKNLGSDNILITLKPFTNGETKSKKIKSNIRITAVYKDAKKALEEMIENIKNNPTKAAEVNIWGKNASRVEKTIDYLENNQKEVTKALGELVYEDNAYTPIPSAKETTVTPEMLDKVVEDMVDAMSYSTNINEPIPFFWEKKHRGINEYYVPEDEIQEKILSFYPEWEKDLWDEVGFDYKKQINDRGELFLLKN